jgi:hypothetical protein
MATQNSDGKRTDEKKTERGGGTQQGERDSKQEGSKTVSQGGKSGSKSGQQSSSGTSRSR